MKATNDSRHTTTKWCADRRNRTLFDMVKSMMAHANLPISFGRDALL